MIDAYLGLRWLHIVSSTVLFGTGLGTAFHMWMAYRRGDAATIATVGRNVVLADWAFTTPAIVLQPVTGIALILIAGHDPWSSWLLASYALYAVAGTCWIPVVWLQMRAARLARQAADLETGLPAELHRLMRLWFALGWPAFISVLITFWLMVAKPVLW